MPKTGTSWKARIIEIDILEPKCTKLENFDTECWKIIRLHRLDTGKKWWKFADDALDEWNLIEQESLL